MGYASCLLDAAKRLQSESRKPVSFSVARTDQRVKVAWKWVRIVDRMVNQNDSQVQVTKTGVCAVNIFIF